MMIMSFLMKSLGNMTSKRSEREKHFGCLEIFLDIFKNHLLNTSSHIYCIVHTGYKNISFYSQGCSYN